MKTKVTLKLYDLQFVLSKRMFWLLFLNAYFCMMPFCALTQTSKLTSADTRDIQKLDVSLPALNVNQSDTMKWVFDSKSNTIASPEFQVDKNFLNFNVIDKNNSRRVKITLVNKENIILRSIEGTPQAQPQNMTWDVSLLKNKDNVRIKIENYGESKSLCLDAIELSNKPVDLRSILIDDCPSLKYFNITPYFLDYYSHTFDYPFGMLEGTSVFDIGITPDVHDYLINKVCVRVYKEISFVRGRSIQAIAQKIVQIVDEEMSILPAEDKTNALREWLLAEGCCAYSTSKYRYAFHTVKPGFDLKLRWNLNRVETLINSQESIPTATCDGFSQITIALSKACGLTVFGITGETRSGYTGKSTGELNHGWVAYLLDKRIFIPADPTNTWPHHLSHSDVDKKVGWRILPRTLQAWEAALAFYFQYEDVNLPKTNVSLVTLSRSAWAKYDATPQSKLGRWYDDQDSFLIGDYTP